MAATQKRRLACPQTIQHLWDAIVSIRQQKQIPNVERIANYMRRKHNLNPSDLDRQLSFATIDELLNTKKVVGNKGSKVGVKQEGYRLPTEPLPGDGHDWYCFECHRGGEVMTCDSCSRVYHSFCVKDDLNGDEKFTCGVCKMLSSKNQFKIKKEDMNQLLGYTCLRLKDKSSGVFKKERRTVIEDPILTKDLHRMPHPTEEPWRHDYLIFHHMDLLSMEEKAKAMEYTRLEEFQSDAQWIVHNVVIYYGVHSPMADMARQMLRDCICDLGEIRQCRDCYRMSNEKNDKFWFCQPCDPPHELVYAKQKGFPYWPAKVIRKGNGVHDVRFFGGSHQRANIERENIRPIGSNIHQIATKRSVSQNKALEELKKHQLLLSQSNAKKKKLKSKEQIVDTNPESETETESDAAPPPTPPPANIKKEEKEPIKEEEMDIPETPPTPPPPKTTKSSKKPPAKIAKLAPAASAKGKSAAAKNKRKTPPVRKPKGPKTRPTAVPIKKEESEDEKETVPIKNTVAAVGNDSGDGAEEQRNETPSSTSNKLNRIADVPTPEDHNVVTSSSQEPAIVRLSVSTQTNQKLLAGLIKSKAGTSDQQQKINCDCDTKYNKLLKEQQERLELEFKSSQDEALKSLAEKLKKEFEDTKSKEINSALEKLHHDLESDRCKAEEQLRLTHQQEFTELQERLKLDISETKKKQWCYNCEIEAIYHCCWNTSYCSVDCQQVHWHKEHKRTCRRKR